MINGFELRVDPEYALQGAAGGARVARGSAFIPSEDYAQIGPEKVLARIPSAKQQSKDGDEEILVSWAEFNPEDEIVAAWVEEGGR